MNSLPKPLVKTKRQLLLMDLFVIIGGLASIPLSRWMLDFFPDCIFRQYGLLCPACGGTRCVSSFVHLDFAAAFSYHPVFFLIILYVIAGVILLHFNVLIDNHKLNRVTRILVHPRAVIVWAVILVVFGTIRMMMPMIG